MNRTLAFAFAALAVSAVGACDHYGKAATPAPDPAAAPIAAVAAPDRFGPCLAKLHATSPRYTAKDFTVPHAPATVTYSTPSGAELVVSVKPRPAGGYFTAPADARTTLLLTRVGC